jgi:hypothetical protein
MLQENYKDFIKACPQCNYFENDLNMQNIFKIIVQEDNIIKQIEFTNYKKCAIGAIINQIDKYVLSVNLVLTTRHKSAIGKMVSFVLNLFGYKAKSRGNRCIPITLNSKYVKGGAVYIKTITAKYQIVTTIENC